MLPHLLPPLLVSVVVHLYCCPCLPVLSLMWLWAGVTLLFIHKGMWGAVFSAEVWNLDVWVDGVQSAKCRNRYMWCEGHICWLSSAVDTPLVYIHYQLMPFLWLDHVCRCWSDVQMKTDWGVHNPLFRWSCTQQPASKRVFSRSKTAWFEVGGVSTCVCTLCVQVHMCLCLCVCVCIHCVHSLCVRVYICVLKKLICSGACGIPSATLWGGRGGAPGGCDAWMWMPVICAC